MKALVRVGVSLLLPMSLISGQRPDAAGQRYPAYPHNPRSTHFPTRTSLNDVVKTYCTRCHDDEACTGDPHRRGLYT